MCNLLYFILEKKNLYDLNFYIEYFIVLFLVIDSCFVKQRCFNPHSGTDSLIVIPVSQASAEQRAGRAGRVRSGKAYRLCTGNNNFLQSCYADDVKLIFSN